MTKLLFGISGLPAGTGKEKFIYETGIQYLNDIGLDAMELAFVRSVNVTEKNKESILKAKNDNDFYLSAHGSYFINLNAKETLKQEQSIQRIIKGKDGLSKVDGTSLVFHPGFYLGSSPEDTYEAIKSNLLKLPKWNGYYRLETTGKPTQFGTLKELTKLCSEIDTCKLCIDFSHIHARYNGCLKNYDDFAHILEYVKENLGDKSLKDMHIHLSGINYGPKGERNHLPFKESDFDYKSCLKALKDFDVSGCIICESPLLEKDALLLKEYYYTL